MRVNLLSPDIYEIEEFISVEEQDIILNYCKNLEENEWWKSNPDEVPNPEEYKKGFFYGKQKLGELPSVFDSIDKRIKDMFEDVLYIDDITLQRHKMKHFMAVHTEDFLEGYLNKTIPHYIRYGIVIYYNDEYLGGEINYPELNITHKPKARSLVMHGSNIPHGTKKVTSEECRYFSTAFVRGTVDRPVILNKELFGKVESCLKRTY